MKYAFLGMIALAALAETFGGSTTAKVADDPNSFMENLEEEVAGEMGITKEELEKGMASSENDDSSLGSDGLGDLTGDGGEDDDIIDNTDDATNPLKELAPILDDECND